MNGVLHTISLGELCDEFGFTVKYAPEGYRNIAISAADINRPGLPLAGFYEYFSNTRIQLIGRIETTYLKSFSEAARRESFDKLFSMKIPAVLIAQGLEPYPECLEMAEKHGIPVLSTVHDTAEILASLISYLKVQLAPRKTLHGVLVEVYGEGVLILGDSGIGKSETAIELVKRGHRLIADDAVEIKRVSSRSLVGSAPENIRYFIELRGIGVVDVRRLFGMGAVKVTENINLVIQMEAWNDQKIYDRLGLTNEKMDILGIEVPSITIPVKPGRNLAMIIEVAAMNHRNRKMGFNAAEELTERIMNEMQQGTGAK
ncbi:MAG: HPr(Ser) kinase/phosphatase [Clostridia bacterium]|nr:HPr(Ser) kinase/phosphatase [Clostridia bacterium]